MNGAATPTTNGAQHASAQRFIVDPATSSATLSVIGSSSLSVGVNGVLGVTINDTSSVIDRMTLGFAPFTFGGQSYSSAHLFSAAPMPFQQIDGYLSIPQAGVKADVFSLVDNVETWGTLVADHDMIGSYYGSNWYISGSFSDLTKTVTFNINATAQPSGTDTDGDGVLDVADNCPAVANPTQAKVASPTLTAPPAVTITSCSGSVGVALGQPTFADLCAAPPVFASNNAPAIFPLGKTTVTWTAADGAGNVSVATQIVTVALGNDASCCPAGTNIIKGTSNNDVLVGTSGADCILGFGGQDKISGGGGNDYISGGDGDDILKGEAGNDTISGGTGQDRIDGGDGSDTVSGDDGDDICLGGNGNDLLLGGQGNDQLNGGAGTDTCTSGGGSDTYSACETKN